LQTIHRCSVMRQKEGLPFLHLNPDGQTTDLESQNALPAYLLKLAQNSIQTRCFAVYAKLEALENISPEDKTLLLLQTNNVAEKVDGASVQVFSCSWLNSHCALWCPNVHLCL